MFSACHGFWRTTAVVRERRWQWLVVDCVEDFVANVSVLRAPVWAEKELYNFTWYGAGRIGDVVIEPSSLCPFPFLLGWWKPVEKDVDPGSVLSVGVHVKGSVGRQNDGRFRYFRWGLNAQWSRGTRLQSLVEDRCHCHVVPLKGE